MSTIKSSTEHLTLNADGAGKEIKFQANGVEKAKVTSTGIDVTGSVTCDGATVAGNSYVGGGNTFTDSTSGYFFGGNGSYTNGVYGVGTNNVAIAANGTERMRIDSVGNVGIGTSSPDAPLEINRATNGEYFRAGTDTRGLTFTASSSASFLGAIHTINAQSSQGEYRFQVAGSEKMRIDSSGNVLVGCTSLPSASVGGSGFVEASNGRNSLYLSTLSTGSQGLLYFWNPNGLVGTITTNGSSTSYNTSSDYRLKELDVPMEGSIDRLKLLRPINFAWKAGGARVDGFFAHEAGEVVPECATGTKDAMKDEEYEVTPAVMDGETVVTEAVMGTRSVPDYQGIDQSKLVPLLVASLQEAVAKIESLEARVTALEV